MSKITPYTALCDIFRNRMHANDKIITSSEKDGKMDVPFVPKNFMNVHNSCQTHPLRDYSIDKVMKSGKNSTKQNVPIKDDNFKILRPDYAAYSGPRSYPHVSPERHNKFKLIAEKPQEEIENKIKAANFSTYDKTITELYRKVQVKNDATMTSPSLNEKKILSHTVSTAKRHKYHTESIVSRISNELLFPDLNLWNRKTNQPHVHERQYIRPAPCRNHFKYINNAFKEQHVHALYRTVSDLKQEFANRYPHCDDEDEKCLCEHCGAWAVIDDSLKRPQIFDSEETEEMPRPRKLAKKRNHKEYSRLLLKLKAIEDRLHELEEMTYVQPPIKVGKGKSSLTFDMYTQCHKKRKRARFQEPEQSRSFSPKRFNPKNCPFPFGFAPNFKEFFWRKFANTEPEEDPDKPEDSESDEDVKVQHESRSLRRRLLPRPKLRCHEYINKKKEEEEEQQEEEQEEEEEEDNVSKKNAFWKRNKETYHVHHSTDNCDMHGETQHKTEENKKDKIEINLDTITDKQIQDLLLELNKRKNRISSPEAKVIHFPVTQINDKTKVLYKREDKDYDSSNSDVPSEAELPYLIKNVKPKELSPEIVSENDSSYYFLKQPELVDKLVKVAKSPPKVPPQNIPPRAKPLTRISMVIKDICSVTSEKTSEKEVENYGKNNITEVAGASMCKFFNNNFSSKTSTINVTSSQEIYQRKPKDAIPVSLNKKAKPKKQVDFCVDNNIKLNNTLPNARDANTYPNPLLPPKIYDNIPKKFIEQNKNVSNNARRHQFNFDSNFFEQPIPKTKPKKETTTISFNTHVTTFAFDNECDKVKNRKKWNFPCLDVNYNKNKITGNNKLERNDNILLKLSKLPLESRTSSLTIFNSQTIKSGQSDENKEEKLPTSDAKSNTIKKKDAQIRYSTENIQTEIDIIKTEPKKEPQPEETTTKPEKISSKGTTTNKSSFFSILKKFSKPRKLKPVSTPVKKPVTKPVAPRKKPPPIIIKSPVTKTFIKTKIPIYKSSDRASQPRRPDLFSVPDTIDSNVDKTPLASYDSCNSKKIREHIFPKGAQNYNVLLCMDKEHNNERKLKYKRAKKIDKYCMFKPQMLDKGTNQSVETIPDDANNDRTDLTINTLILTNIDSFIQDASTSFTPVNNIIILSPPAVRSNLPIIVEQPSCDSVFSNLSVQTSVIQNVMPAPPTGSIVNNNQLVVYSNYSSRKNPSPSTDDRKKSFSFKTNKQDEILYEPACQLNRRCTPKYKSCICDPSEFDSGGKKKKKRESKSEKSRPPPRSPDPVPVETESSESIIIVVSEDELPPPPEPVMNSKDVQHDGQDDDTESEKQFECPEKYLCDKRRNESTSPKQKGKDSKDKDSKGKDKDSKGKYSKGKDSKGKDSKGKDSEGKDSEGKDSEGKDSEGKESKGKDSEGKDSKGKDSKGKDKDSKGKYSKGKYSKGKDSKGKDSEGKDSKGEDSEGKDSESKDSEGKESKGKESKGKDSEGKDSKGKDSKGKDKDSKVKQSKGKKSKGLEVPWFMKPEPANECVLMKCKPQKGKEPWFAKMKHDDEDNDSYYEDETYNKPEPEARPIKRNIKENASSDEMMKKPQKGKEPWFAKMKHDDEDNDSYYEDETYNKPKPEARPTKRNIKENTSSNEMMKKPKSKQHIKFAAPTESKSVKRPGLENETHNKPRPKPQHNKHYIEENASSDSIPCSSQPSVLISNKRPWFESNIKSRSQPKIKHESLNVNLHNASSIVNVTTNKMKSTSAGTKKADVQKTDTNSFAEFEAALEKLDGKRKKDAPKYSGIQLSHTSMDEFEQNLNVLSGRAKKKQKTEKPKPCMGASGWQLIEQINSGYNKKKTEGGQFKTAQEVLKYLSEGKKRSRSSSEMNPFDTQKEEETCEEEEEILSDSQESSSESFCCNLETCKKTTKPENSTSCNVSDSEESSTELFCCNLEECKKSTKPKKSDKKGKKSNRSTNSKLKSDKKFSKTVPAEPKKKKSKTSGKSKSSLKCSYCHSSSQTEEKKPKKNKSKSSLKSTCSYCHGSSKTEKKIPKKKKSKTSKKSLKIPKKKSSKTSAKSKTACTSTSCIKISKTPSKISVKCNKSICKVRSAASTKDPSDESIKSTKITGKTSSSKESLRQGSSESICSTCKKDLYDMGSTFIKKSLCQIKNKITSKFSCKYFKSLYRRSVSAISSKCSKQKRTKSELKKRKSKTPNSRSSSKCPCSSSIINLFCNVESSFFNHDSDDTYSWSETDEDLILSAEEKRQYLLEKLNLLHDYHERINHDSLSNYGSIH